MVNPSRHAEFISVSHKKLIMRSWNKLNLTEVVINKKRGYVNTPRHAELISVSHKELIIRNWNEFSLTTEDLK